MTQLRESREKPGPHREARGHCGKNILSPTFVTGPCICEFIRGMSWLRSENPKVEELAQVPEVEDTDHYGLDPRLKLGSSYEQALVAAHIFLGPELLGSAEGPITQDQPPWGNI